MSCGADALGNTLDGAVGDDTLYGMAGDDTLIGGLGADRLNGGSGVDTVSYRGSVWAAVTVDLGAQTASGGDAAGDTLSGFENAVGGLGDDTLIGSSGANSLFGDAGADQIDGGAGNDVVEGGAGADVLDRRPRHRPVELCPFGSGREDRPRRRHGHGLGRDRRYVQRLRRRRRLRFKDRLIGDGNANWLSGGAGDDTLGGGAGDDTIIGGLGADTMAGGTGIDTLSYENATSFVSVSLTGGFTYGVDAQGDTFSGFENLTGGSLGDALYGDDEANVIRGGGGGDFIDGRAGNDRLYGDAGDDYFYINDLSGKDRIYGFQAGGIEDQIVLQVTGINSFVAAMATATFVNGNTVFHFSTETQLTLVGVDKSQLIASDFVFESELE